MDHNKLWKILQDIGIPDHLTFLLRNLNAGQEATVRTGHGTTTDWFIIRNAGLEEAQDGIKIAGRNIKNLRGADDTIPMGGREEELKSLFIYLFFVNWRKIVLKHRVGF